MTAAAATGDATALQDAIAALRAPVGNAAIDSAARAERAAVERAIAYLGQPAGDAAARGTAEAAEEERTVDADICALLHQLGASVAHVHVEDADCVTREHWGGAVLAAAGDPSSAPAISSVIVAHIVRLAGFGVELPQSIRVAPSTADWHEGWLDVQCVLLRTRRRGRRDDDFVAVVRRGGRWFACEPGRARRLQWRSVLRLSLIHISEPTRRS